MPTAPDSRAASPSETAREALLQLARRRLPPTPENYTAMYVELAGAGMPTGGEAADLVRDFAHALAESPGEAGRVGRMVDRALARGDWASARAHLIAFARSSPGQRWTPLVLELLRGLRTNHAGTTQARKREAIEHVLIAFADDETRAHGALGNLVRGWATAAPREAIEPAEAAPADEPSLPAPATAAAVAAVPRRAPEPWRELLAGTIDVVVSPDRGHADAEAAALSQQLRALQDDAGEAEIRALAAQVKSLWLRWGVRAGEREQLLVGLQSLLRLVVENVGELVEDDRWLQGQASAVRQLLEAPLTYRKLRETERGLRGVLYKQSARKFSLDQAKQAFKAMVADFVANLEELGHETGLYHERIVEHRRRIHASDDIGELRQAVGALVEDTRTIQADILRRRDYFAVQQRAAREQQDRIRELEDQLEALSAAAREDPLTGLLNRRGFDAAFEVESAREQRSGGRLALALLDVDNFKRLNDLLGHHTGDRALAHLADVIRQTLRPTDVVARYGGEEFVIVMPATPEAEAVHIVQRVQRELTRRFFLANNEKVLITFSAGVAMRVEGEARDTLVERADRALYEAKRQGRNRVVGCAELPPAAAAT